MLTAQNLRNNKYLYLTLGLISGLILGLISFSFFLNKEKTDTKSQKPKILNLNISEPAEDIATNNKTLTLTATTQTPSIISINSPTKNWIFRPESNQFSTKIELLEGQNSINITAIDPISGQSQTANRTILYLNEDFSNL